jgi:hypothetical protein
MKVICKENTAKNLDLNEVRNISSNEFRYSVTKGSEYIVMGIMVRRDTNYLYYLIDAYGSPFWLPYELFDIVDAHLSPNWFMDILNKKESTGTIFCLFGFNELCNNEDYHDDLMLCGGYASEIYDKRKAEVEEWYAERALLEWAKKRT